MAKVLARGSTGRDVVDVQAALNARRPTQLPLLSVDGVFGLKTETRVKEFQRANNLKADGIVGPLTSARLLASGPIPSRLVFCGDSVAVNGLAPANPSFAAAVSQQRGIAPSQANFAGLPSLPKFRGLTAAEITTARATFGSSLDFSTVFITDQTGQGDRAFVVAVPDLFGPGAQQFMNLGPAFSQETFIHELTHVWQSQHHSSSTAYIVNCVGSQKVAEALGGGNSAYAYIPGKPFSEYGGEQIAQQVMRGEAPIIAHVKSVAARVVDPENVTGMKVFRFEDSTKPGVKI